MCLWKPVLLHVKKHFGLRHMCTENVSKFPKNSCCRTNTKIDFKKELALILTTPQFQRIGMKNTEQLSGNDYLISRNTLHKKTFLNKLCIVMCFCFIIIFLVMFHKTDYIREFSISNIVNVSFQPQNKIRKRNICFGNVS